MFSNSLLYLLLERSSKGKKPVLGVLQAHWSSVSVVPHVVQQSFSNGDAQPRETDQTEMTPGPQSSVGNRNQDKKLQKDFKLDGLSLFFIKAVRLYGQHLMNLNPTTHISFPWSTPLQMRITVENSSFKYIKTMSGLLKSEISTMMHRQVVPIDRYLANYIAARLREKLASIVGDQCARVLIPLHNPSMKELIIIGKENDVSTVRDEVAALVCSLKYIKEQIIVLEPFIYKIIMMRCRQYEYLQGYDCCVFSTQNTQRNFSVSIVGPEQSAMSYAGPLSVMAEQLRSQHKTVYVPISPVGPSALPFSITVAQHLCDQHWVHLHPELNASGCLVIEGLKDCVEMAEAALISYKQRLEGKHECSCCLSLSKHERWSLFGPRKEYLKLILREFPDVLIDIPSNDQPSRGVGLYGPRASVERLVELVEGLRSTLATCPFSSFVFMDKDRADFVFDYLVMFLKWVESTYAVQITVRDFHSGQYSLELEGFNPDKLSRAVFVTQQFWSRIMRLSIWTL